MHKNTENITNPNPEERVEVYIPKGYSNEEHNLFVSVNGVNYLLPRGKASMVPAAVAAEIHRSNAAQERLEARIDQMLAAGM